MKRNVTISRSTVNPSRRSAPAPALLGDWGGTRLVLRTRKGAHKAESFSKLWDALHAEGKVRVRHFFTSAHDHEVGAMVEALMSSANAI